jgi:hypothetical protein
MLSQVYIMLSCRWIESQKQGLSTRHLEATANFTRTKFWKEKNGLE